MAEWFVVVLGAGGIVGLVLVLKYCDDPWGRGKAKPPTSLHLVDGDPRQTALSVYHDDERGVTCYVAYQYQRMSCLPDSAIAGRDGGP